MVCVKCGFEQNVESLSICAKCGAVQEKVKQVLKSQIERLATTCDELIKLNDSTNEYAEALKNELNEDAENVDYGVLIETKQSLEKVVVAIINLEKNLNTLIRYTRSINIEFNAIEKINKASEHCKTYKSRVEQLSSEIKEIRSAFKDGAVKPIHIPQDDDFAFKSNPLKHNLHLERISEIETDLTKDRFPALGTMSFVYRLLGWSFALLCVVFVLLTIIVGSLPPGQIVVAVISTIIVGGIIIVSIIAVAESIKLGVEIEKNSRATMEYMKVLVEKSVSDK